MFCCYRLTIARHGNRSSTTALVVARKDLPATYQTRIRDFQGMDRRTGEDLLSTYVLLYGRIERKLFAETTAGRMPASLKGEYLECYRIPARMFNGVRVSLEGKVASVREQQQLQVDSLKGRIARAESQIAQVRTGVRRDWEHQKRRRLGNLRAKLERLESDISTGASTERKRPGPADWARPSATGSSGTRRAGGSWSPPG